MIRASYARRPHEGDRVGLGESGSDGSLDCGGARSKVKAFGDEEEAILPVALDLVFPFKTALWHSVCLQVSRR